MTAAAYQAPRPVAASLKQPEVDTASLNEVLRDQGWGVQAVDWVFEAVTGESLVSTIITPITGDWSKIRADGDAWRMVGNAMNDVSYNLTDAVGKVRDHWDGDAARAHEAYIALGWKAGLLAEMGVAQLIAKGFDTVASGAEALGKQAARLLDYLVNKLLEAAATVWIPVGGWIKAAEMVWNAYQIYRRVMDIIDTVKKLIADVKALFDAVGRVFSAIGKLKDADSLAEAMNATQEVAEAGRDVRNAINDLRDDATSIKESATEIADRGRDIGDRVREVTAPPGQPEGAKPAAAVAPGGAPVAPPPDVPGTTDAPATHAAAAAGPAVSAPPPVTGSAPTGGGAPAGGGGVPAGGVTAPPGPNTTHAAGAAPTIAPPSSTQHTPMGGAVPMGAPMAGGAGGGDQARGSGSRPGAGGVPHFPTTSSPSTPAAGTTPGSTAGGSRPSGGLPTPPSHATTGTDSGNDRPTTRPASGSEGGTDRPATRPTPDSDGPRPTPSTPTSHATPDTHPTQGGHATPGSHSTPDTHSTPSPPGHTPTTGDHSTPGTHHAPSSGGGLPSPPGHTPTTGDHSPAGGGTSHEQPASRPHDSAPTPADTRPHDTPDTRPHDTPDTRPHDTGTSGADDVRHDQPDRTPDHTPEPRHDTPAHDNNAAHNGTDNTHDNNNGNGDSNTPPPAPAPDLRGHFDAAAMAAQGQGYQHQLEQMLPDQADRDRYVELSTKLSTELSADEAQHVADVRNQIRVDNGEIVTKALNQGALNTYLPEQPHAPGSKQETWQNQMGGSVARGQDVVGVNTPQGLRDGLALDDKGQGWTPIPEGAPSAMQLRYELTDQNAGNHNVPFGGPKKDVPDFSQPGPYPQTHYQSPQEQAHYEAAQKQMAAAGGSTQVHDGYDPFTGTGYTMGGIPEWRVDGGTPLPDRAEIWQVNADGSEKLHAVYDRKFGWTRL
ncbi:hypothetical protein SAMN05216553_102420 [Lentzea fradiae]|uniref:Proteins of 100 residues with WXG n=1 Tax=Lentzea fradiae TaxID=200378 RepID=A0A1G7MNL2_9PSEU|nr:hypothetical protein [Lentzea fradiae]SDF63216.1 hypothetical protein SAMN05216553_102420 [Lentzea fradiae]